MTMVVGCVLPYGVLLVADTRLTWDDGTTRDEGIKILPIATHTAVGFAGDAGVVGALLYEVTTAIRAAPFNASDGAAISRWMPAFLRDVYAQASHHGDLGLVEILVGSALPTAMGGKSTRIEGLFDTEADDGQASPWPSAPPTPGLPRGNGWTDAFGASLLLYGLRSPEFLPSTYPALQFASIGSGHGVREDLHSVPAVCLFLEDAALSEVEGIMRRHKLESGDPYVGGAYQQVVVSAEGIGWISSEQVFFDASGEIRFTLELEADGPVVRNSRTGHAVRLRQPWEIAGGQGDERFDDIDREVVRRFYLRRPQRGT